MNMHQVPSDPRSIVILADFDSFSPAAVFEFLTVPGLLIQWWPTEAESDNCLGGKFIYRWPERNWTLRGEFKAYEPGQHLQFSWNWDHEPGGEHAQTVDIWLEPYMTSGTRIGLHQGPFASTEEGRIDRQAVAEGWIHFLMRMAGLNYGNATECATE